MLIKDNQFDFSTSIFIGRYKKQKVIHSSSQLRMTRTDFHPKNTRNLTQNNALFNTTQSDNTNDKHNKQVMHTVYHPPVDLTAAQIHMLQQDLDKYIDVNMELDSSRNSDGMDMESDTSDDGNEERENGDEDDISTGVDGEILFTSNTYSKYSTNDYNMVGRQEKLDKVFNTEKKLSASLMIEMEL